jgi:hypothetical protein
MGSQTTNDEGRIRDWTNVTQQRCLGAWYHMKRSYRQISGRRPKPSPLDMSEITNTYTNLYRKYNTLNNQIVNINYISKPINDSVPTKDKIRFAVLCTIGATRRRFTSMGNRQDKHKQLEQLGNNNPTHLPCRQGTATT